MTPEQLLEAANPIDAKQLAFDDAFDDLLAGVLATPAAPRRRAPRLAFTLAAASLATALFLLIAYGPGSDRRSGGAYAEQFADASPLVLLDGRRVVYVDETSDEEGELRFQRGAELTWTDGPLQPWLDDRASDATAAGSAPVLGTTARVFRYSDRDFTALLRYDGRVLEFRAAAADTAAFARLLGALKRVDSDTWLAALPAGAVTTTDRATTVDEMLHGIPLPPGFDAGPLKAGDRVRDRYQLGAAVAGTVACEWFARWASGDEDAIAALRTAKDWPVVRELDRTGDYGRSLVELVGRIPSHDVGDWSGALGCAELG